MQQNNDTFDLKQYVITNDCKYYNIGITRPNNIFLIGLMGSGKTTLGKELSTHFGYKLLSVDDLYIEIVFNKRLVRELSTTNNQIEKDEIIRRLKIEYCESLQTLYLQQTNTLIEGLQPLDMYNEYWTYFKNQTVLIKNTGFAVSTTRAIVRDESWKVHRYLRGNYELSQRIKEFEAFMRS